MELKTGRPYKEVAIVDKEKIKEPKTNPIFRRKNGKKSNKRKGARTFEEEMQNRERRKKKLKEATNRIKFKKYALQMLLRLRFISVSSFND